jgi:hypothetical protein
MASGASASSIMRCASHQRGIEPLDRNTGGDDSVTPGALEQESAALRAEWNVALSPPRNDDMMVGLCFACPTYTCYERENELDVQCLIIQIHVLFAIWNVK